MRWIDRKSDDIRIRKRFAWLPVKINNETRWLETVYIKQRRLFSWTCDCFYWDTIKFVNKADYLNWKAAKKKNNGN